MLTEIKPPQNLNKTQDYKKDDFHIFLCGSIEQNKAIMWQNALVKELQEKLKDIPRNIVIFNPRRDHWDSSLEQNIDNKEFANQVEWELEHMERANLIIMYLQPNTKSPISLLELGLNAKEAYAMHKSMLVLCPEGFWRKGNVDIVCQYYDINQVETMGEMVRKIVEITKTFNPERV